MGKVGIGLRFPAQFEGSSTCLFLVHYHTYCFTTTLSPFSLYFLIQFFWSSFEDLIIWRNFRILFFNLRKSYWNYNWSITWLINKFRRNAAFAKLSSNLHLFKSPSMKNSFSYRGSIGTGSNPSSVTCHQYDFGQVTSLRFNFLISKVWIIASLLGNFGRTEWLTWNPESTGQWVL